MPSSLVTHLKVHIKSEPTLLFRSALTYAYVNIFTAITAILFSGRTLGCTRKSLISNLG